MRRRRKGKLIELRQLVPGAYPRSNQADFLRLVTVWNSVISPRIVKNAQPVRFDRGRLTLHTMSSTWATELDYMQDKLLRQLRAGAPRAGLSDLRFRVGRIPPQRERGGRAPRRQFSVAALPEELARELARIKDDDVRDAIAECAGTILGRAEQERQGK